MSQSCKKRKNSLDSHRELCDDEEKISPPNKVSVKLTQEGEMTDRDDDSVVKDLGSLMKHPETLSDSVIENTSPNTIDDTLGDLKKGMEKMKHNISIFNDTVKLVESEIESGKDENDEILEAKKTELLGFTAKKQNIDLSLNSVWDSGLTPSSLVQKASESMPISEPLIMSSLEPNTDAEIPVNHDGCVHTDTETGVNSETPKTRIYKPRQRANSLPNEKKIKQALVKTKLNVKTRSMRKNESENVENLSLSQPCLIASESEQGDVSDNLIIKVLTQEMQKVKTSLLTAFDEKISNVELKLNQYKQSNEVKLKQIENRVNTNKTDLEAKMEKLDTKIKNNKIASDNQEKVLAEKVKNINTELNKQQKSIKDIKTAITDNEKKYVERVDAKNKEVEEIKRVNNTVKSDLNKVKASVEKLQEDIEKHLSEHFEKEINIGNVQQDAGNEGDRLTQLETRSDELKNQLDELQKTLQEKPDGDSATTSLEMPDDVKDKISSLETTVNLLETQLAALTPDPCDVVPKCLVVNNLHYQRDEDLHSKCRRLVEAIYPDSLPVLDCKRMGASTESKPAPVKLALASVTKKVNILRNKDALGSVSEFSNVFIRASRDHVERQMRKNFDVLKEYLPEFKRDYRMSAHSLLMEKYRGPETYADAAEGSSYESGGRESAGRRPRGRGRPRGRSRGSSQDRGRVQNSRSRGRSGRPFQRGRGFYNYDRDSDDTPYRGPGRGANSTSQSPY